MTTTNQGGYYHEFLPTILALQMLKPALELKLKHPTDLGLLQLLHSSGWR